MTATAASKSGQSRWPLFLLPVLAFCIVLPLVIHGPSCGHDYAFHLQSWIDASEQIRHGNLLPRWAFSPAYNAGEPRFLFYPPISWWLGSLLRLVFPYAGLPTLFTWCCLTAAALAMYSVARQYVAESAALLASAAYIANPYILFTAFERTAYAELLSAAWIPLLFGAALAERLSVLRIAIPLALVWLTNAPAAVMGTYAFVLILLIRAGWAWYQERHFHRPAQLALLGPAIGGLVLGLALPAFYLVPAAWQRRYVQIAMAIIPNIRVEDNFLFGQTGYGPHEQVLHTASIVALEVTALTLLALAIATLQRARTRSAPRHVLVCLMSLAVCVILMLWHFTLPLWHLLPELAFLQFPWRLLTVLGCVLGLGSAMALGALPIPRWIAGTLALAITAGASFAAIQPFRQGCDVDDSLPRMLALYQSHHGVPPTDEYTPTDADNGQLRWDDPAYWLADTPNAPAPNTVPNPAATSPDYDQPAPVDQTISGHAPMHLHVHLSRPEDLILNLRDYPTWRVSVNGHAVQHVERDDGLLAVALPASDDSIDIRWHTLPDMWLGDAVTICALVVAGWLGLRSRRIEA